MTKPSETWLFDGWNVLHGLSSLLQKRLSSEALTSLISGYCAQNGYHGLLIWDGFGPGASAPAAQPAAGLLSVIFSDRLTADAVLERYLYDHRGQGEFVAVTDDGAMTRVARGLGARVFSVKRLAELLDESRQERDDRDHKGRADSHGFNRPFDRLFRGKGWDS